MSTTTGLLVLLVAVSGVFGQTVSNDASTVSPQDIFDLSEDDFQLWIFGREPKAWESASGSNGLDSTTPTPQTTSVLRTSPTNPTTATPLTTPNPLDIFTSRPSGLSSDGKSWIEDERTTQRPDVLGEQFKPAGEDFAQWLEGQMNKVQEVTFAPHTTLTVDRNQGSGFVTRLTTSRNRIPLTTFAPSAADGDPFVTVSPPASDAPATPAPAPFSPTAPSTPFLEQPGDGGRPIDLQKWLRDQLQISQSLTDRLLSQWSASGAVIRADGHSYTPSAVSYQTSALVHGLQGVVHSAQVHNDLEQSPLPFPGSSHSGDSYLSQPKPAPPGEAKPTPSQPQPVPIRRVRPTTGSVFFPADSFHYSHPSVPHYVSFVGNYRAPLLFNYH